MRFAVLGFPIAHSKSPAIHAAAYAALGLDWHYERVELVESQLRDFLAERGPEWGGFSLTMPLKFEALALSTTIDEAAKLTGAVNTLIPSGVLGDRRWQGFNTDVAGIVDSLAENGIPRLRSLVILGGGATAGSAIVAAARMGARQVTVALRNPQKDQGLRERARLAGVQLTIMELEDAAAAVSDSDLLLNTLPGGVDTGLTFARDTIRRVPLYDVAYSPWPSALGAQWQRADAQLISGLGMLLRQALVQVRIFVHGDPKRRLENEAAVYAAMKESVKQ